MLFSHSFINFRSDRVSPGSDDGAEESPALQPRVYTYVCDVSKRESVYATAEQVRREVGDVTFLVNNAGVVSGRHLLECPDELIERTMMVNCHAHFWVSRSRFCPVCVLYIRRVTKGRVLTCFMCFTDHESVSPEDAGVKRGTHRDRGQLSGALHHRRGRGASSGLVILSSDVSLLWCFCHF